MKTKTVRFTQVVAKCGQPVVHDQWVAPEKDAPLKQAVKGGRVMTVHIPTVGSQKDHGEVGLVKKGRHVLLVFPRSLRAFAEKRVVGINYDLLKVSDGRRTVKPKPAKAEEPSAEPRRKSAHSEAVLRLFLPDGKDETKEKTGPTRKKRSTPAKVSRATSTSPKAKPSAEAAALRTHIRKALKQLQTGKAVMAYQTLEKALE